MRKIFTVIIGLLLASCAPESNIQPTIDRTDKEILIRVTFHPDKDSMEDAYRAVHNLPKDATVPDQLGFANWNEWIDLAGNQVVRQDQQFSCEIHTFKPIYQDDDRVLTMGHELLHCVYGKYHD